MDTGLTLELEPVVAPDGRSLSLTVEMRYLTREGTIPSFRAGDNWRYQHPKFRLLHTGSTFSARSGEWQLLHVGVRREPAPEMEFLLLRATALPRTP